MSATGHARGRLPASTGPQASHGTVAIGQPSTDSTGTAGGIAPGGLPRPARLLPVGTREGSLGSHGARGPLAPPGSEPTVSRCTRTQPMVGSPAARKHRLR